MYVHDCVNVKLINLQHVSGDKMTADMLTKAAERNIVQRCVKEMGLIKL